MWCRRLVQTALGLAAVLSPAGPAIAAAAYSLQPELFVRETYDDNVDRVDRNRRDDFITALGAGITLRAGSPRLTASAGYRLGAEFFAKETENQGQLTHTGSLSFAYQATRRLTLRVGDGLRDARTTEPDASLAVPPAAVPGAPVAPPPAVEPGAIPTRRVQRIDNTATGGFEYLLSAHASLAGTYSFAFTDFDAPDLVDSRTHRASLDATQQVGLRDRIGAGYGFSFFQFDDPARRDRQSHDASVNWSHVFSETTTATASVGALLTERNTGGGFKPGVAGSAGLTTQAGLTRYSAAYARSVTTTGGTGVLQTTDRVALGVAHEVAEWLTAGAGAAYSRNRAIEGALGPTNTYSATASLAARVTRSLRASIGYTFERVEAPAGGTSFRNNRAAIGLTLALPPL